MTRRLTGWSRRGPRVAAVVLTGVLLSMSAAACGPPAEPCRFFATSDQRPLATPEAAVAVSLYQAAVFPDGSTPVLDERTGDRAVYRLRNGGRTVGWITANRDDAGWTASSGTTCADRPTTTDATPPTSR